MRTIDQGLLLTGTVDMLDDCVFSLDVDGTIRWASPGSRSVVGWRPEELTGCHISVVTPNAGAGVAAKYRERLHAGERVPPFSDVGVKRDGRSFKAAVRLCPVRSTLGTVVGITMVLRDLTRELDGWRDRQAVLTARHALLVVGSDLVVREANEAVRRVLGREPEKLLRRRLDDLLHLDDVSELAYAVDRVRNDSRLVERLVVRMPEGPGDWRHVEATLTNRLADPDVRGFVVQLRDVTREARIEEALVLSGALHQVIVENSTAGILALAPDGGVMYANETVAELLGVALERLIGSNSEAVLRGVVWADPAPSGIEAGTAKRRGELHRETPHGDRILDVTLRDLSDQESHVFGSMLTVSDVTEARRAELVLRQRALYDPLTGLPNRYLSHDRLEMAAARRRRRGGGTGIAVLFLDLDGLKLINDRHGHHAGDQVLQEVARRLVNAVRATDTVGRLGGDEFLVVCEGADEDAALRVAARIVSDVCAPVQVDDASVEVAVSVGVALSPPYDVSELVHRADAAMYQAKRLGGGRLVVAGDD